MGEQLEAKEKVLDIQKTESTKPASEYIANIQLPMTEASDAWMDDFVAPPSDDEQEKEEHLEEKEKVLELQKAESTKPASENKANISLPMTEASDAWMDDFEAPVFDSDDEQEKDNQLQEKEKVFDTKMTESTKPETESKANISLLMTEASDAWMDDFEAPAFDSDDEQEKEEQLEAKEKVLDIQ